MVNTFTPSAREVPLESKVAFLRQPASYPEPVYRVEAIETHMSWIFMTEHHAYKLKKPVCHEFLDFRTIEARRFYCDEEVRLNRRLAADVYLGVVSLGIDATGHLHLDAAATPADWLVRMRRLPIHLMLDYAIGHGTAGERDAIRIAQRLADFYRAAPPIDVNADEYRARFLAQVEANHRELVLPAYRLPAALVGAVCTSLRAMLVDIAPLLDERVYAGRIVEGHGDLRPEHVCLNAELSIIDCLEFSRALRTIDPLDEVSYLALECERLAAPEFGTRLLRSYAEWTNDHAPAALSDFYQAYRAVLRAALAIRHLNEEKFRYSPEWPRRATHYLRLAERHLESCQ